MRLQRLYDRLPVVLQHAMASAYGYRKRAERFGAAYREHRRFLEESASWSRVELERHQAEALRELVGYAATRSPFYGELYADVEWEGVRTPADLGRLPVVTKEMLRANLDRVITVERAEAAVSRTGGTTGTSLEVLYRLDDNQRRMAVLDHFKALHGFEHGRMRRATFSGKHIIPPGQEGGPWWRYNHAMRQMVYSSFHVTPETAPAYLRSLRRFRPASLDGFVTTIFDLASWMLEAGERAQWGPVVVFPTSETVTDRHREVIEEAFGCPVRDQYASSEGAPFVYECAEGSLHFDVRTGVIEPGVDDGAVVVTSFVTHGTPLIRYAIGDAMRFEPPEARCPCGLDTPLVASIEGRASDALFATNGARVNLGNVANVFKTVKGAVRVAQVIQEAPDELRILVVLGPCDRDAVCEELASEARYKFGRDMRVRVEVVDDIPLEASGKRRFTVNRMAAPSPGSSTRS